MNQRHSIEPDAARITESLRDTGYVFNTAVADLVDNSIAADADHIEIEFKLDPMGNVRFSILDNGTGMDQMGLVNALRYGSSRRGDPSSLGKFGLGLKTASTAFSRAVKLTSKTKSDDSIRTFVLDLDFVGTEGWFAQELDVPDPVDAERIIGTAGTVLRWDKVDKVIKKYQEPTGTAAKNAISKLEQSLRLHLAMIFQRFLDAEDSRARNVVISLNGNAIEPWNPFGWVAELVQEKVIQVATPEGEDASLRLRVFILPRKSELQAALGPNAHELARLENPYQGVYVFRENRMIHGPDWLGMFMQEPHGTLCRVEMSFDYKLDDAFQIDIKKSQITLEPAIEEIVKKLLAGPRREANARYREGTQSVINNKVDSNVHAASNAAIRQVEKFVNSSTLSSFDLQKGQAVIKNKLGEVTVAYEERPDQNLFVEAVNELKYGVLYEPLWINQNPGVRINKSHPYYTKVYVPNLKQGVTVQALDSLLWALATAEMENTEDSTRRLFEDLRMKISSTLERLVEDLPEPEIAD